MKCIECNGNMVGDGYTMPLYCENTEVPDYAEADSGTWYCNFEEVTIPQDGKDLNEFSEEYEHEETE